MKRVCDTRRARVLGGKCVFLQVQRFLGTKKVQIAWPQPVCADACTKVLKEAMGKKWRDFVTDPAVVQGAPQAAATAREEEPPRSPGPPSSGAPATMPAAAGRPWQIEAATLATFRQPNLLPMKLEAMTAMYLVKDKSHYEDLPQQYTVEWKAQLGEGTYGQVYVGKRVSAKDLAAKDDSTPGSKHEEGICYAIKLHKDTNTGVAAEQEVRRHAVLGLHPNIVGLLDVVLVREPESRSGCNSPKRYIGLVCELYETDVREFLKITRFTQGGMRHLLTCVLEGLRFLHGQGCVHCDLKPGNIFMRGAKRLRGCFFADGSPLQQHTGYPSRDSVDLHYQIPNSFEVCGGGVRCPNHVGLKEQSDSCPRSSAPPKLKSNVVCWHSK